MAQKYVATRNIESATGLLKDSVMISNEKIQSEIEIAFAPYRCVSEIGDYGQKLSFRIFNSEEIQIFLMKDVVLSSIRDTASLNSLISAVRQRLQNLRIFKGTSV